MIFFSHRFALYFHFYTDLEKNRNSVKNFLYFLHFSQTYKCANRKTLSQKYLYQSVSVLKPPDTSWFSIGQVTFSWIPIAGGFQYGSYEQLNFIFHHASFPFVVLKLESKSCSCFWGQWLSLKDEQKTVWTKPRTKLGLNRIKTRAIPGLNQVYMRI